MKFTVEFTDYAMTFFLIARVLIGNKHVLSKRAKKQKSHFGVNCQKPTNGNHAKIRNHRRHSRLVSFESLTRDMTDRSFGNFFSENKEVQNREDLIFWPF